MKCLNLELKLLILLVILCVSLYTRKILLQDLTIGSNSELEHSRRSIFSWKKWCNCPGTDTDQTLNSHISKIRLTSYNSTTCSWEAFQRGYDQNVISYSLYYTSIPHKRSYFDGVEGNLKIVSSFYPDHTIRVYFGGPYSKHLCDVSCEHSNLIDLCHIEYLPGGAPLVNASNIFPMIWRFFPTLDPQVRVFLSRDLDSRFSDREVRAVHDWLLTEKSIHSMRDHWAHDVPLLGAAWGSQLIDQKTRNMWKQSWTDIMNDKLTFSPRTSHGPDQDILTKHIWVKWGHNHSLQHDSFYCEEYAGSVPFPSQRMKNKRNNFVAAYYNDMWPFGGICPYKCRPSDHKDWISC